MAVWLVLQIALDLGLVGLMLWLSWRPDTGMLRQRAQLGRLTQEVDGKIAELHSLLQRADATLRGSVPAAPPPLANPYEEAARLAQEGHTLEEIVSRVQLPREEIGLILHLNRREAATPDRT